MSQKPASILIVLLVGTGLTYFFWEPLWFGGGWIGGDMYSYYLPQKLVYQEALKRGDWALWNDVVSLGYPQHAESQTGTFYPFHLLFYSTLSLNDAYHMNQLVHYIIAFTGMAVLTLSFGLSLRAALLAGLVYVYGWFPARSCLEWAIIGGAWLPWALWSLDRYLATRWMRYLIGLALLISLQLLPGHFALAFITLLTLSFYALAKVYWVNNANSDRQTAGSKMRLLASVGAAFVAGFLIAGIQLLPTWELKRESQRDQAIHDVGYGVIPTEYLAQVIMPWRWYGMSPPERDAAMNQMIWLRMGSATNQSEAHLYFGLLPFLLAFSGLIPSRQPRALSTRQRVLLWGLAILAVTYACGWWLPITSDLPGFSFFIGPGRYGIITTLAVALLAAEAADRWLACLSPGTRTLTWGVILLVSLADLSILPASVTYTVTLSDPPINYRDRSPLQQFLKQEEKRLEEPVRLYAPGANLPSLLGFSAVPEYLGLGPEEYYLDELKVPTPPELPEGASSLPIKQDFLIWLQSAGVTHLLMEVPLSSEWPAELVFRINDPFLNACWARPPQAEHFIYELKGSRDRWYWDGDETETDVELVGDLPHRKEYRVATIKPNQFVVTELMSPGWRVFIDDEPADPVKVEQLFRGVDVPAGEHRIVWSYEPRSFTLGIWLSLTSVFVLAVLAHIRFWHPQRLLWFEDEHDHTDDVNTADSP